MAGFGISIARQPADAQPPEFGTFRFLGGLSQ
jgi:hypothetical protein